MDMLILTLFVGTMLYVMGRTFACYLRVCADGLEHSEALLRGGVTLSALWNGQVPDRGNGSVIPAREGLWMEAGPDKLEIHGTRTIARDII
jgi:hypothetical protein